MKKTKNQGDSSKADSPTKMGVVRPDLSDKQNDRNLEHGGPKGPEPTRYGDWERKGRCIDF